MSNKTIQDYITKFQFLSFNRCPRTSWLQKNVPLIHSDPYYDHLTVDMTEVRYYFKQLFKPENTLTISKSNSIQTRIKQTRKAMENPDIHLIFNPTFTYNGFLLECEGLRRSSTKWDLLDVKPTLSLKRHHFKDIAYQKAILAKKNIVLDHMVIYILNRYYIRGENLNPSKLFLKKTITKPTHSNAFVYQEFKRLRKVMAQSLPDVPIGLHCIKPVECRFKPYCWENVPLDSIFRLKQLNPDQLTSIRQQNITSVFNLPHDFHLNQNQKIQVETIKSKSIHIDCDKIKSLIESLTFPLYFLDFECVQQTIPQYPGEKPFNQLPFQFSLHIQKTLLGPTQHVAWVNDPKDSTTQGLSKALVDHIHSGSVIVYAKQLEEFVLTKLAKDNPKFKQHLLKIKKQIVDLSIPFANKWIYTKEMEGSHSIKSILPALAPRYDYKNLIIKNGEMASKAYIKLTHEQDPGIIAQTIQYLKEYCEMDTLAMVKIFNKLVKITQKMCDKS